MKAACVALALLFALDLRSAPRAVEPADLVGLPEVGEVRPSPDGTIVIFTVTTHSLWNNRSVSRVMQVPGSGGAVTDVAALPEGASTLRWSPDSKRVAFFASKDGKRALWTLDMATRSITRVCDSQRGNGFLSKSGNTLAWSPDGTQLAFAGTLEPPPSTQDPIVVTRILYKSRTALSDNRRSHIHVVPASGGTPRALTQGEYDEHSIDWGGKGDEIVFLSNRERDPDAVHNYDIFAVNVRTGATRRLTNTPGVEMNPVVSPDGSAIACVATKRKLTTIDSVAEDDHAWLVPMNGGPARELNASLDRRSSSPVWSPDGRSILYTASDRGRVLVYRVSVNGGDSVPLLSDDGQAGSLAITDKGAIFYTWTHPVSPREVYRLDEKPVALTNFNEAAVREWKLSRPERIEYASFDGTRVEGWLYPDTDNASKSGMILSIHGGPHGMHGYAFNPTYQLYAARGYATLAINPRGSSGYGQKFSDGCLNDWGGGDYKDLMTGADHVLKQRTDIDPARLGVTGGSYGGFMTNWVITQTARFQAAVSVASLSNLISFYATSLYQDLVHVEFNGFPWDGDNFAALWKWSPLAHVKNVSTPTLFLHGEADNDVHITQAEEMYTAMRMRGVESALVRYPRAGHGFTEPKHRVDAAVRTLDWMDRFLKKNPQAR
ncbi:MAG: S9 family peptidase [Bryobacteraceae bacterium]